MNHWMPLLLWDGYPINQNDEKRAFPAHLFVIFLSGVLAAFFLWMTVTIPAWSFQVVSGLTAAYLLLSAFVRIYVLIR